MILKQYLKDSTWSILYLLIVTLIVNTVVILSNTISNSIYDIIYLNLLLFIASLAFILFGFYRWKSIYKDYKAALDSGQDINLVVPRNKTFEAGLLRDTIRFKNREFHEETEHLRGLLAEINEYITLWVHEIKIPISVCELISSRLTENQNTEYSGAISDDLKMELERIRFLVDQVLYASRVSSYSEDLSVEEISLEQIAKEVVKKNAAFFVFKKIAIDMGNLDYYVLTDQKWISYILQQLLNNAYKYVGDKGKVSISAVEDEISIKMCIRDNGIGIQKKDLGRVFDKGFTGDNGRKTTKSTGMGLYFSKKMLDKLGHDISVSSQVNSYTEFTITFYKISDYLNVT